MTTAATTQAANPYLDGFLAPVSSEVSATDLPVTGRIPEHLDGRYLRNGPNPAAEVDPAIYHWFTGDAMVHGVALRDGQARWYRNRWVRTPHVCAVLGERAPTGLNPRAGMLSVAPNTNVLSHAGLIRSRREGRSIIYTADFDAMRELLAFLMEDCCAGKPEICAPLAALASQRCAAEGGCA